MLLTTALTRSLTLKPITDHIEVQGNLPGVSKRMTVAPEFLTHIMRILIRQYSDRELAVLRELSTNARDSHIMAGKADVPIEVSLPAPLSPYLVIRDYGLGLSEDEVYELFGCFGASTKRDSDEVNGTLGIGSKSPLAYTNQFTMTCVQDGVLAIVAITRDEDGVGKLTTVSTLPTDDTNGVEIKVPVRPDNHFETKAREFFRYWKTGTVLMNGQTPEGFSTDTTMQITDTIYLQRGANTLRGSVVVMGDVPYPAPQLSNTMLGLPNAHSIVAYATMGQVEFTPSREALEDTQRTRNGLAQIKKEFQAGLEKAIQEEISGAQTAHLALKKLQAWGQVLTHGRALSNLNLTWHGKKLPTKLEAPTRQTKNRWGSMDTEQIGRILSVSNYIGGRRGRRGWNQPSLDIDALLNGIFITGFEPAEVSLTHHKKMIQWKDKQPSVFPAGQFYCVDWDISAYAEFIDDERMVEWEVIKTEKLPKQAQTLSGRIPGSFNLVLGGKDNHDTYGRTPTKTGVPGDDIDQTKPVFYCHGNERDAIYRFVPVLDHFHKAYTIICLQENRLAKFRRENPTIPNAVDVIKEQAEKLASSMTKDQKIALAMQDDCKLDSYKRLGNLQSQIKDPDVLALVKIAQIDILSIVSAREQFRRQVDFPKETWENVIAKRYPLIPANILAYGNVGKTHIRYMNAEYDYLKKVGKV